MEKTIAIVCLVILLSISIGYNFYSQTIVVEDALEEKAILGTEIYDWGENELDSNELLFGYRIYNYGKVEAKNVKVRCNLWDEGINIIKTTVVHNTGNVASASVSYKEVIAATFPSNLDELFSADCFVESCDDCEILWKKIPELADFYNS